MATKVNEILQFASQDTGANLLTQAEYDGDAQRVIGHQPGIARSRLENKVLRQCSTIAAGVAQFMLQNQDGSVTDSMTPQEVADALTMAIGSAGGTKMNRVDATIINNTAAQYNCNATIPNGLYSLVDIVGDSFTLTVGMISFILRTKQYTAANTGISASFDINLEGKPPATTLNQSCAIIKTEYTDFEWVAVQPSRAPSSGGTIGVVINGKVLAAKNADTTVAGGTLLVFYLS